MHDISAEAGISVGLIYRYFQNKEAVISPPWPTGIKGKFTKFSNARDKRQIFASRLRLCSRHIAVKPNRRSRPRSWSIFSLKRAGIRTWPNW